MAKERQNLSKEVEPEEKKRVTRKGLNEIAGIFKFIIPYKWSFIFGMIFLILSTGTTLTLPYFLGELVDSAVPRSATRTTIESLKARINQGEVILSEDIIALRKAQQEDNTGFIRQTDSLISKIESGETLDLSDLTKLQSTEDARREQAISQLLSSSSINQIALVLVLILVLQSLFSFFRIYLFARVSERGMADIRHALYAKIITLPMIFFEQRRVGELTSRLSSDVTQLHDMLSFTLAEFFRQILTLIIGVIILITLVSSELTLFMLATFPLLVIAAIVFGRFIRKLSKKAQDELAYANTLVEETLQAIIVVKSFTNEWMESRKYETALSKVVRTALKSATFRGVFVSFIFIALFGGVILVIWRGALMIQAGEIQVGELISFMLYTAFIGGSVAGMGNLYGQLQKTIGASERIREILGESSELELIAQHDPKRLRGEISFRDVQFSYPSRSDIPVLDHFDLHISPGEKVALVGHSGAGKSTVTRLLLQFYTIEHGALYIDGQLVANHDLSTLRANIGVVPQEVILFGGTIRENIAYGRVGASEAEIIEAAEKAYAWEFIQQFPEGLDTIVGERGIKLSGGQRQRIAIARAILKDPAILILDEATSSLDSESERLVQAALDELMKGRTTLIIAHRLSTIRKVDNIYVLDKGKVIESGSHQELSRLVDGAYQNLLKLQFEEG